MGMKFAGGYFGYFLDIKITTSLQYLYTFFTSNMILLSAFNLFTPVYVHAT